MRCGARASTGRAGAAAAATAFAAVIAIAGACAGPSRDVATVVYASGADLEGMNAFATIHPLSRQVQRYVLFVTLLRADERLAPTPYFARRWAWSTDRRTLTLTTLAGLRWHDGQPTTAHDAAFTLAAARDPVTGYARAAELASFDSVYAADDTTLVIQLTSPPPELPRILSELPIMPAHRLAALPRGALRRDAFALSPVGNGPFHFTERRPGQRWVFERNPDFPAALGGPPLLRRLVVAVVDEPTTKLAGLVSGELDVAGIAPTMASLAARDPTLRVLDYPVLLTYGLFLNAARPPFDDARVRHALDLSLDRDRLVTVAIAGFGTPAAGPVPSGNPLAVAPPVLRDTAAADALFAAAGWRRDATGIRHRGGVALACTILTVGTGDNLVEQLLQADLAARGVRVEIRSLEFGAFLAAARRVPRQYDALVTGIPGDLSLGYVAAMFDGRQRGGALDYADWHTAALDARFLAVRAARSEAELRTAWHGVQQEIAHDLPVAWLFHARGVQGIARRLAGVTMDLRGELVTVAQWHVGPGAMPVAAAR